MAVAGDEGAFLSGLRRLAPGLGLVLFAIGGAGWHLGWWQEPSETIYVSVANGNATNVQLRQVTPWPPVAQAEATPEPEVADEPDLVALVEDEEVGAQAPPDEREWTSPAEVVPQRPDARRRFDLRVGDPRDGSVVPPSFPSADNASDEGVPPVAQVEPTAAPIAGIAALPRAVPGSYVVVPGDTLGAIAIRHGVSLDTVRLANNIGPDGFVRTGQTLRIPTVSSPVHLVERGETLSGIAARYGASQQAVAAANGLNGTTVVTGQRLVIPGSTRPRAPATDRAAPASTPVLASRNVAPTRTPTPKPTPRPRR